MPDFSTRSTETELMDDLTVHGEVVPKTLKELNIINKFLGGNYVTIRGISKLLLGNGPTEKPIRIADMGCGGGDILKSIANWARKRDLNAELIGIDANPNIIDYAKINSSGYSNIEYRVENVFDSPGLNGDYDIILSTLFLHHFDYEQSTFLLRKWSRMARIGVVVNDLHRHPMAYHSISLLTNMFSRSYMVKNDGPVSVLRAFSKQELINILKEADISSYSIHWYWAFRWGLIINQDKAIN